MTKTLVSVAMFDHPSNPSHPTWWHARTYGLVAANPFGVHDFEGLPAGTGDVEIPAGASITFRYRVWIRAGIATASAVDLAWERFADR